MRDQEPVQVGDPGDTADTIMQRLERLRELMAEIPEIETSLDLRTINSVDRSFRIFSGNYRELKVVLLFLAQCYGNCIVRRHRHLDGLASSCPCLHQCATLTVAEHGEHPGGDDEREQQG